MPDPKEKPADVDALMEKIYGEPHIAAAILVFHGFPFFLNRWSSASW
jgi:hypothetical protein